MNRPHIALVYPGPLFPPIGGGARRVLNLAEYLKPRCGCLSLLFPDTKTTVLPDDLSAYCHQYRALPTNLRGIRSFGTKLKRFLQLHWHVQANKWESRFRGGGYQVLRRRYLLEQRLLEYWEQFSPDAVIANFAWSGRLLANTPPGTYKILDTHDLQHVRQAGPLDRATCSKAWEIQQYEKADLLLGIEPGETAAIQQLMPSSKTKAITVPHAVEAVDAVPPTAGPPSLLFIGNAYAPNVDGMKEFLRVVWPALRQKQPDVTLNLVGKVGDSFPHPPEGVNVLGFVDDLEALYREASIVVNPTMTGTGLKIKSVEALSQGKCLVATTGGLQGLIRPEGPAPWVETELTEMADALHALLQDTTRRVQLAEAGLAYIRSTYSPDACYGPMLRLIEQHLAVTQPAAI